MVLTCRVNFLWREDDKKGYACVLLADIALLDD